LTGELWSYAAIQAAFDKSSDFCGREETMAAPE
jgi:hypothetical protein